MSRIMQRVLSPDLQGNVVWTALTCPAGHKYEVLEVFGNPLAFATRTFSVALFAAATTYPVFTLVTGAASAYVHERLNAMLLYDTDQLRVFMSGTLAQHWNAVVTYMDVTL